MLGCTKSLGLVRSAGAEKQDSKIGTYSLPIRRPLIRHCCTISRLRKLETVPSAGDSRFATVGFQSYLVWLRPSPLAPLTTLLAAALTMRTGLIWDWRRTRQQVVQQKFAWRVKAGFNPFRDSAGCTIAMRWQRRLKSNSSEDQTLLLETRTRRGSHFLRASFAGRRISLPSKTEVLTSSGEKSMPAQRFGEQQPPKLGNRRASIAAFSSPLNAHPG